MLDALSTTGMVMACGLACGALAAAAWRRAGRAGAASRLAEWSALACLLSVALLVARDLLDLPHAPLRPLGWCAWSVAVAAACASLRDTPATRAVRALYLLGLALLGMLLVWRDLSPGRFVVWTNICELTGFILVAALVAWLPRRFPGVAAPARLPLGINPSRLFWFQGMQFVLATVAAGVIAWILLDPAFAALGVGKAILGLAGHRAAKPASLMLLGATMLMAWQSSGAWRALWQYAAFGAGLLFTTSLSWAGIDPGAAAPWSRRALALLVSTGMITLLTRFGLARVLPRSGDWIPRARKASVLFASLAVLMAAMVLLQRVLR